jgi:hypothetical protein
MDGSAAELLVWRAYVGWSRRPISSQTTTKSARTHSRNAGSLTGSEGRSRPAMKERVRRASPPRASYSRPCLWTAAAGLSVGRPS